MLSYQEWAQIIRARKGKVPNAHYPPKLPRYSMKLRCNKCHRPMKGTTAYDGACACGGLIENVPFNIRKNFEVLEASWTYTKPGDQTYKKVRDDTARDMRKDGWEVTTETTSLDYFFVAQRRRRT